MLDRRSVEPYGVNVLFTQPYKLAPLCVINKRSSGDRKAVQILTDHEDVLISDVERIDLGPRYFATECSDSGGKSVRLKRQSPFVLLGSEPDDERRSEKE